MSDADLVIGVDSTAVPPAVSNLDSLFGASEKAASGLGDLSQASDKYSAATAAAVIDGNSFLTTLGNKVLALGQTRDEMLRMQIQMQSMTDEERSAANAMADVWKQYEDTQKAAKEATDQHSESQKMLESVLGSLGVRVLSVTAALAAIVGVMKESVEAFAESEAISNRLNAMLKLVGESSGVTRQQIDALSSSLSKNTIFDDEKINQAATSLLKFTTIAGGNFDRVIKSAADLAALTGQDLVAATETLGRAIETGSVRQLKMMGMLNDSQLEHIKTLRALGDEYGVIEEILGAVEAKSKRAAQELGSGGLSSAWKILGNATNDAMEELGEFIARSADLELVIRTTADIIRWITDKLKEMKEAQKPYEGLTAIEATAVALGKLYDKTVQWFKLNAPQWALDILGHLNERINIFATGASNTADITGALKSERDLAAAAAKTAEAQREAAAATAERKKAGDLLESTLKAVQAAESKGLTTSQQIAKVTNEVRVLMGQQGTEVERLYKAYGSTDAVIQAVLKSKGLLAKASKEAADAQKIEADQMLLVIKEWEAGYDAQIKAVERLNKESVEGSKATNAEYKRLLDLRLISERDYVDAAGALRERDAQIALTSAQQIAAAHAEEIQGLEVSLDAWSNNAKIRKTLEADLQKLREKYLDDLAKITKAEIELSGAQQRRADDNVKAWTKEQEGLRKLDEMYSDYLDKLDREDAAALRRIDNIGLSAEAQARLNVEYSKDAELSKFREQLNDRMTKALLDGKAEEVERLKEIMLLEDEQHAGRVTRAGDIAAATVRQNELFQSQVGILDSVASAGQSFLKDFYNTGEFNFQKLWDDFKHWAFAAFAEIAAKQILVPIVGQLLGFSSGATGAAGTLTGPGADLMALLSGGKGGGGSSLTNLLGLGNSGGLSAGASFANTGLGSALGLSGGTAPIVTSGWTSMEGATSVLGAGGAAGLTDIGSAVASGLSMVSAAAPYIGVAMLAFSMLSKKGGGPKVGGAGGTADLGSFGVDPSWLYPGETGAAGNKTATDLAKATQADYDRLIALLGGTGTAQFLTSFSTDPKGTAQSTVSQAAMLNGQQVYASTDNKAGRDEASLQAELSNQAMKALIAALAASNLPQYVKAFLGEVVVTSDTVDSIIAATVTLSKLPDELQSQFVDLYKVNPAVLESLGKFNAAFVDLQETLEVGDAVVLAYSTSMTTQQRAIETSHTQMLELNAAYDASVANVALATEAMAKYGPELGNLAAVYAATAEDTEALRTKTLEYMTDVSLGSGSVFNKAMGLKEGLQILTKTYDGSTAQTEELAKATGLYVKAAAEALQQIGLIKEGLEGMFGDSIRQIDMAIMTNTERSAYLKREVEQTIELLKKTTDPTQIDKLSKIVNSDLMQVFQMLSPAEQKAQSQWFITQLKAAGDTANAQLIAAGQGITTDLKTGHGILDDVRAGLNAAAKIQYEAAVALGKAAGTITGAVDTFDEAVSKGIKVDVTVNQPEPPAAPAAPAYSPPDKNAPNYNPYWDPNATAGDYYKFLYGSGVNSNAITTTPGP